MAPSNNLHYVGVAPVELQSGGRVSINRSSLRFAPEFGGVASAKEHSMFGGNPSGIRNTGADYDNADLVSFGAKSLVERIQAKQEERRKLGRWLEDPKRKFQSGPARGKYKDPIGARMRIDRRKVLKREIERLRDRQMARADRAEDAVPDKPRSGKPPKMLGPKRVKHFLGKKLKGRIVEDGSELRIYMAAIGPKRAIRKAERALKRAKIGYKKLKATDTVGVFPGPVPGGFLSIIRMTAVKKDTGGKTMAEKRQEAQGKAVAKAFTPKGKIVRDVKPRRPISYPSKEEYMYAPKEQQGSGWQAGYHEAPQEYEYDDDEYTQARYNASVQALLADAFGGRSPASYDPEGHPHFYCPDGMGGEVPCDPAEAMGYGFYDLGGFGYGFYDLGGFGGNPEGMKNTGADFDNADIVSFGAAAELGRQHAMQNPSLGGASTPVFGGMPEGLKNTGGDFESDLGFDPYSDYFRGGCGC